MAAVSAAGATGADGLVAGAADMVMRFGGFGLWGETTVDRWRRRGWLCARLAKNARYLLLSVCDDGLPEK